MDSGHLLDKSNGASFHPGSRKRAARHATASCGGGVVRPSPKQYGDLCVNTEPNVFKKI